MEPRRTPDGRGAFSQRADTSNAFGEFVLDFFVAEVSQLDEPALQIGDGIPMRVRRFAGFRVGEDFLPSTQSSRSALHYVSQVLRKPQPALPELLRTSLELAFPRCGAALSDACQQGGLHAIFLASPCPARGGSRQLNAGLLSPTRGREVCSRPRLCENSSRKRRRRSQTSQIALYSIFSIKVRGRTSPKKLIFGVFTQPRPEAVIARHRLWRRFISTASLPTCSSHTIESPTRDMMAHDTTQ
jgi:hypothetical protein